ncbi:hypothetical protein [Desulfofundulus kuznetsovii]|uniref:hypothetical protein n=1 Tax=Desulfofundulus kuznetsovii TaxID=58135 RepID=UPI00338E9F9D
MSKDMADPQSFERGRNYYNDGAIIIVALLLAYVHEPESFRELAPLEEMLARLSKEELISLISKMIEWWNSSA